MALKACSSSEILECSAQRTVEDVTRERDRISELPEDILVNILSLIQTRDSVRTSILSKGWRNVWTSVPVIEINSRSLLKEYDLYQKRQSGSIGLVPFEDWFENFVDGLILSYKIRCVRELRLCCDAAHDSSHVRKLILVVTRNDDFKKLNLSFYSYNHAMLNSSTFICKKVVILTLSQDIMLNLPSSVYLPNLKQLHLVSVSTLDVDSVQKLLAGCPVLEKLHIERHDCSDSMKGKILCIMSSSLKSLTFYSGCFNQSVLRLSRMVIYAPNLEQLDLLVDGTDEVEITSSMTSLATVDLRVRSTNIGLTDKINVLIELLMKSNTKYLYLSAQVVESFHLRNLGYLPILKNLRHCKMDIFRGNWPILSFLLESSPNLISFVCYKEFTGRCHEMHGKFHPPKCVMLYLEKIELHRFGLHGYEMEMMSYFLENTPALKTMSITSDKYLSPEAVPYFHGKVLNLPKASTACEIYVRSILDS